MGDPKRKNGQEAEFYSVSICLSFEGEDGKRQRLYPLNQEWLLTLDEMLLASALLGEAGKAVKRRVEA